MFEANDLKWCKNVLRNKGSEIAYEEVEVGVEFILHWSDRFPGTVLTAQAGEVILLFQKPKVIAGRRNSQVLLTHLVVPIDEQMEDRLENVGYRHARKVLLIAKPDPIDAIPKPSFLNFKTPNRGLTNPLRNISDTINLTEDELKQCIWDLFDEYSDYNLVYRAGEYPFPAFDFSGKEGDREIRTHVRQEIVRRNTQVVRRAKEEALKRGEGRLLCACCDFDFMAKYGEIGKEFIEAHHRIPLADGKRITRVEDLALVCSNCHRMLHRKKKDANYHSPESLRELLDL